METCLRGCLNTQATVQVLRREPSLMFWPCLVILSLMIAGSLGIYAVARNVAHNARNKEQISESNIKLLKTEKLASEQMIASAQLADLETASVASISLVTTAVELVRPSPKCDCAVREVCAGNGCS